MFQRPRKIRKFTPEKDGLVATVGLVVGDSFVVWAACGIFVGPTSVFAGERDRPPTLHERDIWLMTLK